MLGSIGFRISRVWTFIEHGKITRQMCHACTRLTRPCTQLIAHNAARNSISNAVMVVDSRSAESLQYLTSSEKRTFSKSKCVLMTSPGLRSESICSAPANSKQEILDTHCAALCTGVLVPGFSRSLTAKWSQVVPVFGKPTTNTSPG